MLVSCSCISVLVRSFIWRAFSSKKFVLNCSMFSFGMGFRILGGSLLICDGVCLASSVFGGICSVTGEWSEFRS